MAMEASITLLEAKVGVGRHHAHLMMLGYDFDMQQSTLHVAARSYIQMMSDHFMSYIKFSRPYVFMNSRDNSFFQSYLLPVYWIWPEQLDGICRELTLLPDKIICRKPGCFASKDLSLFLLLRRWHVAGNCEAVSYDIHQQHSWCIQIYQETVHLLAVNYRSALECWINAESTLC